MFFFLLIEEHLLSLRSFKFHRFHGITLVLWAGRRRSAVGPAVFQGHVPASCVCSVCGCSVGLCRLFEIISAVPYLETFRQSLGLFICVVMLSSSLSSITQ